MSQKDLEVAGDESIAPALDRHPDLPVVDLDDDDDGWDNEELVAGVIMVPKLFRRQRSQETGETRIKTLKEWPAKPLAVDVGLAYVMALDLMQLAFTIYFPRHPELAKKACEEINRAMQNLEFYYDLDEHNLPIPRCKKRGQVDDSPLYYS